MTRRVAALSRAAKAEPPPESRRRNDAPPFAWVAGTLASTIGQLPGYARSNKLFSLPLGSGV